MLPVITVATGATAPGSVASLTVSHASDGNPLLVIGARFENLSAQGGCTFNGVALIPIGRFVPSNPTSGLAASYALELYLALAPDAVTANVVYTPVAADFICLGAYSIRNWGGSFRFQHSAASSTAPSTTITGLSATDELLLDFQVNDNQAAQPTEGGGQTVLFNVLGANDLCSSSKPSADGAVTLSWTLGTSDAWSHVVLALQGAGESGGGGGSKRPVLGEPWG